MVPFPPASSSAPERTSCPDENDILSLARGTQSDDASAAWRDHLDSCMPCQELVAALLSANRTESTEPTATGKPRSRVLNAGTHLGRYRIRNAVGEGAMGIVYLAEDPQLNRSVAIKILRAQNDLASARLMREAQALARISHPNVIVVHEVGTVDDHVFMAMEFVDGSSLTAWLASATRPTGAILETFVQAGRGLAVAHAADLVHRDFKPDNVLVGRDGRVRVVDFGLAREDMTMSDTVSSSDTSALGIANSPLTSLTQTGAFIGTPAYMAPEQYEGKRADARTDQFGYAIALFEALYGARPFRATSIDELSRAVRLGVIHVPPVSRVVPRHIEKALVRALSVEPTARFPSMDAFLTELTAAPAKGGLGFVVLALVLVSAVALGGWMMVQPSGEKPRNGQEIASVIVPDTRAGTQADAGIVNVAASVPSTALSVGTTPTLIGRHTRPPPSLGSVPTSPSSAPSASNRPAPAGTIELFDTLR